MAMSNQYAAYDKFALNKTLKKDKDIQRPRMANALFAKTNSGVASHLTSNKDKVASQYLENAVFTASQEELTLMLYDGAIRFINKAVQATEVNEIEKAHNAIIRAQDIFAELMHTLNMDYDLSQNLHSLYDFIRSSLMQANVKKDAGLLKEMLSLTRELRDTWAEAMKLAKKEMQG